MRLCGRGPVPPPNPGTRASPSPYAQSLSFNKDITLGRPFVVNVTARAIAGTVFGYNGGGGIPPNERLTATRNALGPDVVEIVVAFSEPVSASCGEDDDEWATVEQSPGVRVVACRSVRLRLKTSSDDALAGSANLDSTTGAEGEEVFPTGFMAPRDTKADEPNEVALFSTCPGEADGDCSWAGTNAGLQYVDEFALEVLCAVPGAGGAMTKGARTSGGGRTTSWRARGCRRRGATRGGACTARTRTGWRGARVPPRTTLRSPAGHAPVLVDAEV